MSSEDYAALISSSLHPPLINNLYGSLSDQVCHSNALIREAERMLNPNPVNQTSVPGMKEIDTAISTLDWDQYHDGQRPNRGKLKAVRFKGLEMKDPDYGTGRLDIAQDWTIDEVLNADRFRQVQESERLVGVEGKDLTRDFSEMERLDEEEDMNRCVEGCKEANDACGKLARNNILTQTIGLSQVRPERGAEGGGRLPRPVQPVQGGPPKDKRAGLGG